MNFLETSMRLPRAMLVLAMLVALGMPALAADNAADPKAPAKPAVEDTGMMGSNDGGQIYQQICAGCHMADGRGAVGAGSYPAFVGNTNLSSSRYVAITILNGRRNMPAFAPPRRHEFYFPPVWLNDLQVANVVNYIRSNFGNNYPDPITAEEVRALQPDKKSDKK